MNARLTTAKLTHAAPTASANVPAQASEYSGWSFNWRSAGRTRSRKLARGPAS